MVSKEEVMRFVGASLDRSKLEDFQLKMMAKKGKLAILIDPREKTAQELIDEA